MSDCTDGVAREKVSAVADRTTALEDRFQQALDKYNGNLEKIWKAMEGQRASFQLSLDNIKDKYANRLPNWASMVMAAEGAAIGGMVMWILDHLK